MINLVFILLFYVSHFHKVGKVSTAYSAGFSRYI